MNFFIHACYLITLGFIRLFKWIELGILILASPIVTRIIKRKVQEVDISIFEKHVPPENSVEKVTLISSSPLQGRSRLNQHINIALHDKRLFARVANRGTIAVGEGFMNKSFDLENQNWEDLTEVVCRVIGNQGVAKYYNFFLNKLTHWLEYEAFNKQSRIRALRAGKLHYDLGYNIFETMLDPWMQYSCAYWKTACNLNDAQIAKLEMVCQKLDLKPGMTVLDIGCGWGTLSKYMAEKYQVKVVGVTIGKDGAAYAERVCKGLPVEIKLQDYRDVKGKFDRVVSVAAFEHFGASNHREFFKTVHNCLEDDGIALLQTIGMSYDPNFILRTDPWLNKYIFSDFMVPYQNEITQAIKGLFTIEDWHNFGLDYAKTMYAWRENFVLGWPNLKSNYDEKFFRMWIYYLSMGRALFLTRRTQLWQIVLSKGGLKREYRAYR